MPIDVTCDCGKRLSVAESLAGTRGNCVYCEAEIYYPKRRRTASLDKSSLEYQTKRLNRELLNEMLETEEKQKQEREEKLDRELAKDQARGRNRRILAAALVVTACAMIFVVFVLPGIQKRSLFSDSRDLVFAEFDRGRQNEAAGDYMEAYTAYSNARGRARYYLDRVDSDDGRVKKALEKLEQRLLMMRRKLESDHDEDAR